MDTIQPAVVFHSNLHVMLLTICCISCKNDCKYTKLAAFRIQINAAISFTEALPAWSAFFLQFP